MNLREKICMQMGSLLLTGIEASDQLEQALANTSAKDAKIAELQKSIDARDSPSDAPAPMEIPSANVETVPAASASDGIQPA